MRFTSRVEEVGPVARDARASSRFERVGGRICRRGPVTTVHVVVPDGIDDPARPSGGNRYDRRLCGELAASGWDVRELVVPGPWPRPDAAALSRLARAVGAVPDGGLVLLDGLIASAAGAVLVPESRSAAAGGPGAHAVRRRRRRRGRRVRRPHACPRRRHDQRVDARSGCSSATGCPRSGCTSPDPGRTGARRRPARPAEAGSCASARWCRTRGTTCCSTRSAASRRRRGTAPSWVRSTGIPRSSSGCAARPPTPAWPTGSASPDPGRARSCAGSTGPRTCWSCRRGSRRTEWSSPRRWPSGCRFSRPPSAGCPRRWGGRPTARRGCSCRPATRTPSARRSAPGCATPSLRERLRRAAHGRRAALEGWAATARRVAAVLARGEAAESWSMSGERAGRGRGRAHSAVPRSSPFSSGASAPVPSSTGCG